MTSSPLLWVQLLAVAVLSHDTCTRRMSGCLDTLEDSFGGEEFIERSGLQAMVGTRDTFYGLTLTIPQVAPPLTEEELAGLMDESGHHGRRKRSDTRGRGRAGMRGHERLRIVFPSMTRRLSVAANRQSFLLSTAEKAADRGARTKRQAPTAPPPPPPLEGAPPELTAEEIFLQETTVAWLLGLANQSDTCRFLHKLDATKLGQGHQCIRDVSGDADCQTKFGVLHEPAQYFSPPEFFTYTKDELCTDGCKDYLGKLEAMAECELILTNGVSVLEHLQQYQQVSGLNGQTEAICSKIQEQANCILRHVNCCENLHGEFLRGITQLIPENVKEECGLVMTPICIPANTANSQGKGTASHTTWSLVTIVTALLCVIRL